MILISWFLSWCFCSGLHSPSCAEGTPLCRSEPVPREAPRPEGRFSCQAHSGLWDTLSHVSMYIVLPFPPPSFSPNPRPAVLTRAVLTHQRIPVSHLWLAGNELRSFLWADAEESCQPYFLFSSLFVSILFQLSVDFTLLAGTRSLPSTNFFKLNPFFLLFKEFCQDDVTANPVQLCWPNPWIQISVASLCCSPKHVMLKGAESWPGYLTYIPTTLGFICCNHSSNGQYLLFR